jgi:sarcosine oxidase subunit alpha
MSDEVTIFINGVPVTVSASSTVCAALLEARAIALRRSATGEPRGPLCGMGVCFECRVTIDGQPHRRSCQILCREGMDVRTDV